MSYNESIFIRHSPCPDCGSKDNLGVYSDHTYCFGCHTRKNTTDDNSQTEPKQITNMITGEVQALTSRKIKLDTCKTFNYEVGFYNGQPVQIANYYNKKFQKVAQHLRFPDKSFIWLGDLEDITLFGQNNWRDGGKMVGVTEGEIDCMTVSQVCSNNKYPVVSVPSGATSAKKYIKRELEWLSKFENIILMFDTDEAGTQASLECSEVLPVKKVKIARYKAKDPNELLLQGKEVELIDSVWGAKQFTPQGIILGQDTLNLLLKDNEVPSIPYLWNGLNKKLFGFRFGELVLLCAGSGTGKSQVCREIAYDVISKGFKVGYIALEESVQRSIRGIVSVPLNAPIHIPSVRLAVGEEKLTQEFDKVKNNICFYNHFGSSDSEDLLQRIRFLVNGLDCKVIFLDHISIVISGLTEGDERRLIDNTMTKLRGLVEELKCALFVVSHLKRPPSGSHEEGLQVSLTHLRGSHSLATLSDAVIALERNQQDENESNIMIVRVLKNRFSGDTGVATNLFYNKETGRLSEVNFDERQNTN